MFYEKYISKELAEALVAVLLEKLRLSGVDMDKITPPSNCKSYLETLQRFGEYKEYSKDDKEYMKRSVTWFIQYNDGDYTRSSTIKFNILGKVVI